MGEHLMALAMRASASLVRGLARRPALPQLSLGQQRIRSRCTLALDTADANVDPRRHTVPINGNSPTVGGSAFVAPSATLIGQVDIADKAGVWYHAVLRGDMNPISVGFSSHIKDGSVVTVDASLAAGYDASTVIGNFVTVGARCFLKACTVQ